MELLPYILELKEFVVVISVAVAAAVSAANYYATTDQLETSECRTLLKAKMQLNRSMHTIIQDRISDLKVKRNETMREKDLLIYASKDDTERIVQKLEALEEELKKQLELEKGERESKAVIEKAFTNSQCSDKKKRGELMEDFLNIPTQRP